MKKNIQNLKSRLVLIILAFIFFLALSLRLKAALWTGTWLDEASVYVLAATYDFRHLALVQHWDAAHPPLLYLLIRLIIICNNFRFIPVIYLRIPFVIFSSLAVIPVYLIASKIIKNKFALFIPFWYSIHPFQILMGYSMRPYALLQFLLPLAMFAFFEESWNKKWKIIFWNIFFIFLFFWDYASLWFFLPFFLWNLFKNGIQIKTTTRILIKKLWPFFMALLLWLPGMIIRAPEILVLINYTRTRLAESFLILNGVNSTWVYNNIYGNQRLFWLNLAFFSACMFINIFNVPLFLFFSVIPLALVAVFNKFISPILVNENLIYVSLIFIFINGIFLKREGLIKKIIYGCIISVFLMFNLYSADKDKNLAYPGVDLSVQYFNFTGNHDYAVFSFNEYLDYVLKYNILQRGYLPVSNSYSEFYADNEKFNLTSFNLQDAYQRTLFEKLYNNKVYSKIFISHQIKRYTQEDKQIIDKYCLLSDQQYESFINNQVTFVPCQ